MWRKELISALKKELLVIQQKNPRYSLRAYSKKLGVGGGSLSDILNKKRSISLQLGKKILAKLTLDPVQSQRLAEMIKSEENKSIVLLPNEAQKMVENWYLFTILSLLELESSPKTLDEIAVKLNLSPSRVTKGINLLLKWGFLKKNDSHYSVSANSWQTTDNIPSASIRKSHLQGLDLAQKAVMELPIDMRDITSLVFPGSSTQLEKVRVEIRKFIQKVHKIMSVGEADSIYKFNAQLFPLDKWNIAKSSAPKGNSGKNDKK